MVHSGIRCDSLPGCGYVVWQDAGEFTFTTDSVFVAAFAHLVKKAQVLELGSGTGAISLFLAARGAEKVTGIEFNPKVTALMERSIKDNGLEETVKVIGGDLREINKYFKTESMDLVIANPPYRNSGNIRKIGTAACHEVTADLRDFFKAAAYAVRYRGRFAIVQLPDRFAECMQLAAEFGLQPKRLQWVHSAVDKPAWIFLMEMVKGGSYGLDVLPPLVMYNADGTLSAQALAYYDKSKEQAK